MQLGKEIVKELAHGIMPSEAAWHLPERILQFGTGVLLRGLPDYFIDRANAQGVFNGRIVVVKSTPGSGADAFKRQDGMFTLLEKGVRHGQVVDNIIINTAISRVLSAADEWDEVLACAGNPDLQIVISNTTEVGIVLDEADAGSPKPVSFPGRLLAFLETRYRLFGGSRDAGMVVVPAELIVDNGTLLKSIVLTLARLKRADDAFLSWLETANTFCNSLVDCIVPGKLPEEEHRSQEQKLGYEDELMIMSEPYRLWAIETDCQRAEALLSFSKVHAGVVIAPDINKFRELKLRLLNAPHTFACAVAILAGFATVKEGMQQAAFESFLSELMVEEIAPLVVQDGISLQEAVVFAKEVLDRFRNPYIQHRWVSISAQYSLKMVTRCVPLIEKHYLRNNQPPARMAFGFAAYLLYSKPVLAEDGVLFSTIGGIKYLLNDDKAVLLNEHWQTGKDTEAVLAAIMADSRIFGRDLTQYEGWVACVHAYFVGMNHDSPLHLLHSVKTTKSLA